MEMINIDNTKTSALIKKYFSTAYVSLTTDSGVGLVVADIGDMFSLLLAVDSYSFDARGNIENLRLDSSKQIIMTGNSNSATGLASIFFEMKANGSDLFENTQFLNTLPAYLEMARLDNEHINAFMRLLADIRKTEVIYLGTIGNSERRTVVYTHSLDDRDNSTLMTINLEVLGSTERLFLWRFAALHEIIPYENLTLKCIDGMLFKAVRQNRVGFAREVEIDFSGTSQAGELIDLDDYLDVDQIKVKYS